MQKISIFTKRYDHIAMEKSIFQQWEKNLVYVFSFEENKNFVIDTPPPTISGKLHIGHVYSYTQSDFIARYKRMRGFNVFYPIGFDDNGLATERFVEKKKSVKSYEMPKDKFIKLCGEVIKEEKKFFIETLQNIGLSIDWNLLYTTSSDYTKKISQMSFIDLYKKGEIYRDVQPVIWDVSDQTALAQADLQEKKVISYMHKISFKTDLGKDINIATTRPELLPACLAIFVHAEDKRYSSFIGANAYVPLFGLVVPILSDDLVDPEKGTGAVMCCSFGDQTDLIWVRKYNLKYQTIIQIDGRIKIDFNLKSKDSINYVHQLNGLRVKQARAKILEFLAQESVLLDSWEVEQVVKIAERSATPIEFVPFPQWFVYVIRHKESLQNVLKDLVWHPQHMKIKMDAWINSIIFDWCISRQRVFGISFPVWYSKRKGEEGKILLADITQLPVDPHKDLPFGYSREEVEADKDVMDTWATSALTPQINANGISEDLCIDLEKYQKLFPTDLRSQAHEIIRTWAFYTVLKSFLHNKSLPWKNIMISGWCLASDKSKMSKSKGNVIEPSYLLKEYGADAIRYWSGLAKTGMDTAISIDVLKNGKKFLNKLWSVANFISNIIVNIKNFSTKNCKDFFQDLSSIYGIDRLFIQKIYDLELSVRSDFDNYKYYSALYKLEKFFLSEFCDYYIEIVKKRIYRISDKKNENASLSAINSVFYIFENMLRMLSVFLPYITEEIFQNLYKFDEISIHQKDSWPSRLINLNEKNTKNFEIIIDILDFVRGIKSSKNFALNHPISCLEICCLSNNCREFLYEEICSDIQDVLVVKNIVFLQDKEMSSGYTISNSSVMVKVIV
ncbi:MAG: valine--tRNA ligase [Rickettsia sp.]|nr:valine--tRNA ligase [Rickettsia sp.]